MRIGVARSGTEKSNLKERTFRSLSVLLLESRVPSGGVVEAGPGGDQHQVAAVLGGREQQVGWCNVREFEIINICSVMLQIVYLSTMTWGTFSTLVK